MVDSDAVLVDHTLRFDLYSAGRRGGVANIRRKKGSVVRGVLYWIPDPAETAALDRREGAPFVYRRQKVTVMVQGKTVEVVTYVGRRTLGYEIAPSAEYAGTVLRGIRDAEYREQVERHINQLGCAQLGVECHGFSNDLSNKDWVAAGGRSARQIVQKATWSHAP